MELDYRHEQGKIVRLATIHLPVMELKSSVAWYTEHLGFQLLKLNQTSAELATMENGVVVYPTLALTTTDCGHRLNYEKRGKTRSMVMMHASNLEGLRDEMLQAGATVTLPHADQEDDGCGRFFEAVDPSGNIIQIQANEGEPAADHSRVEAIFNLEIPVSDVRRSARFYVDVLGFQINREPDDQSAIVKTGPFYAHRFCYDNVQEFGFFLIRHDRITALHFEDSASRSQECLVLQADDTVALHAFLSDNGHTVLEETRNEHLGTMSFIVIDPDGNRIQIVPQEKHPTKETIRRGERVVRR